jgi:hypothetical protein
MLINNRSRISIEKTLESISNARDIMESFDPSPSMTVGFDNETYSLTKEQMTIIAGALYLADCEIHDLQQNTNETQ